MRQRSRDEPEVAARDERDADGGSARAATPPRTEPMRHGLTADAVLAAQRTMGNRAVQQHLLSRRDAAPPAPATSADGGTPAAPVEDLDARLDRIDARYRDMIRAARTIGAGQAADNLEWFLAGSGSTRAMPVEWLRSYGPVTSAERRNQQRFEEQLTTRAEALADGGRETFTDYWDAALTAWQGTELYYASGTSQLRSTATFTLSRSGDTITITGTVHQRWFDPYDWNAGQAAAVPGFGDISDDDGLLIQQHRGARPFMLETLYDQTVSATVVTREYWFDSHDYTWSGP